MITPRSRTIILLSVILSWFGLAGFQPILDSNKNHFAVIAYFHGDTAQLTEHRLKGLTDDTNKHGLLDAIHDEVGSLVPNIKKDSRN